METLTVICSDASIAKYKIVYGDQTDTTNIDKVVTVSTGSTQVPIGVTQFATTAEDQQVTLAVNGVTQLYVDGSGNAIDIGDKIIATSAGIGIISATPDATAQEVLGIALAPSGASGDIIPVLIARQSLVKGTA